MKLRKDISAGEVEALHERLDRLLDRVGLETQPRVALRILDLAQRPDAQLRDYGDAIKTDAALTGRLLRLANSAFYAQRTPVVRLERALVLLGIDRTKAVALGFYLEPRRVRDRRPRISRLVWGQSVYRASLCAALARTHAPKLIPEAYVVGLMLDCGQPLMARLQGDPYVKLHKQATAPPKLYSSEFESLEYTHVDVVASLMKRWRMPALLARPICWHHTPPPVGKSDDPQVLLQRIGYYAGAVQLCEAGTPNQRAPLPMMADRLFAIGAGDLETVVRGAGEEYRATVSLFSDTADQIENVDSLSEAVQSQLVEVFDEQLGRTMRMEARLGEGGSEKFAIAGCNVEVEPGRQGEVVAYIASDQGERIMSCTVDPGRESPDTIRRLLGLDDAQEHELSDLIRVMRSMAA